eukprot:CAMPEP_0178883496 /NCGR_PEP_ID=MMETSP0747-20121128/14121_1 /TAXON_ID=913974 /ORGANISM="Nitzschia punctata, Strain CCMP561" /LENGTH=35 /DNA_ID= /DNA_START= /DNA_END= /DNA_ORIENTATION=
MALGLATVLFTAEDPDPEEVLPMPILESCLPSFSG